MTRFVVFGGNRPNRVATARKVSCNDLPNRVILYFVSRSVVLPDTARGQPNSPEGGIKVHEKNIVGFYLSLHAVYV